MIAEPIAATSGSLETLLVVDDTFAVLSVVIAILGAANFRILQANSGDEAVCLAREYASRIDLLLSDVQMPEMSGPELRDIVKVSRPDIHVMFMSGLDRGDLLVLNYGWAFIAKPFVGKKLVDMVNAVLHTPDRSQGSHHFDSRKDLASRE